MQRPHNGGGPRISFPGGRVRRAQVEILGAAADMYVVCQEIPARTSSETWEILQCNRSPRQKTALVIDVSLCPVCIKQCSQLCNTAAVQPSGRFTAAG